MRIVDFILGGDCCLLELFLILKWFDDVLMLILFGLLENIKFSLCLLFLNISICFRWLIFLVFVILYLGEFGSFCVKFGIG